MAVNFPNSPSTNDTHTENGLTWKWDGTTWIIQSIAPAGPPGPPGNDGSDGSDGTPGPTGPTGSGSGDAIGTIISWSGSSSNVPSEYQICDGSVASTTALQTVLGTTNVPDLRGRFIVHPNGQFPSGSGVTIFDNGSSNPPYYGLIYIIKHSATPSGPSGPPGPPGSGGGASVTTDDNPPTNPSDGDLWWDSEEGVLNVYYEDANTSQWVNASGRGNVDLSAITASIPNLLFQTKNWNIPF